jgi:hypothetical protein
MRLRRYKRKEIRIGLINDVKETLLPNISVLIGPKMMNENTAAPIYTILDNRKRRQKVKKIFFFISKSLR